VKRNLLIGFIFVGLTFSAQAGTEPDMVWHKGAVVLSDNKVLPGEVCVQGVYDLVLFRSEGQITVYPAHKLHSLRLYDEDANINRRYISRTAVRGGMKVHHVYEVIVQGPVSILRRQNSARSSSLSDAHDFDYFLIKEEEMFRLEQFREKIYPVLLASNDVRLTDYIKQEHLNPNFSSDAIRIIQFYNKIQPTLFVPQAADCKGRLSYL
jgi:hypothetical protein